MQVSARTPSLLIVDDDSICVMAFQRGLRKAGVNLATLVAHDGQAAIDLLQAVVKKEGELPPLIISLDLNMPRMGGVEFLNHLRADPHLSRAIVVIYTTSDAPSDVGACYDHNIAGYIVKERDAVQVAKLVGHYADTVTFPI